LAGEIGWASAHYRNDQLTAAAAMAGQDDVARAALRELRRAQPQYFAVVDRAAYSDRRRCGSTPLPYTIGPNTNGRNS
jgi:hypothetical protein